MEEASDAELLRKMALFSRRATTGAATKAKVVHARAHASGAGKGGIKSGAAKAAERVRQGADAASGGQCGGHVRECLLATILERQGTMAQRDLASAAGSKPSALSEALSKLEADGYVVRETNPADRRSSLVKLTEQGARRAAEVARERAATLGRIMGCLTCEERVQLDAILDKLLANLDAEVQVDL